MSIKNGGAAFPVSTSGGFIDGMTLRDYFAAKTLPTLIAATWTDGFSKNMSTEQHAELLSIASYCYADAMLKARGV